VTDVKVPESAPAPGEPTDAAAAVTATNRRRSRRAVALAVFVVLGVLAGAVVAALRHDSGGNGWLGYFCFTLPLAIFALWYGRRAEAAVVDVDGPIGDEQWARKARRIGVIAIVLAGLLSFGLAVWSAWQGLEDVGNTFFSWKNIEASFPEVVEGFKLNILVFVVAEILVLIWGLIIATMRQLPGKAAAPLRWFAIAYVDLFRGLPAIITIYLVVFGLPLTNLPLVSDTADVDFTFWGVQIDQLFILGVLSLTLVYGAYVAEVYRSGIESIHWSQRAAARGLGLTQGQSLRYVVFPQAIRRVIPPLMNDFIGLQKDTALLNVAGVLEGFNVARIYAGNSFNLSSFAGLGICFLVITIPMTRVTDYLVKRDQQRTQAGGA
jgi:His/Glu/Gln/Arg/opine family amino acid ABC transporter permease subunit